MFSVDNLAFVVSVTLLAGALIVAGLVLVTAGNRSARVESADNPVRGTSTGLDTNAQAPEVTSTESVSQAKETIVEPVATLGSSGAIRVSFTVVACPEQSGDQGK